MITKEVDNINKCCLYANDFHLEMILLPYIKENLGKSKFVILTQNNLKDTIKILLEKVNLSKKDISELYKIDWSTKTEEKIKIDTSETSNIDISFSAKYMMEALKTIKDEDILKVIKEEKIKNIQEYSNNKNKTTVVINGNVDFVKENIEIINSFNKNNIDVIECYNVEDLKSTKINIEEYEILNTKRI